MKRLAVVFALVCASLLFAADPAKEDLKVTVLGSSTVWGNGLLDEHSMAGVLDNLLRDRWSTSVYPKDMKFSMTPVIVKNRKFFRGEAAKITGKGASVEFELTGDQLVVYQAIARTRDYAEIAVYADGKKIGTFDNRNPTLGHEEKSFDGNSKKRLFPLGRAFTYNHKVTVDGKPVKFKQYDLNYVTGPVNKRFPGFDGVIVRGRKSENVEHYLYFFTPPTGKVAVSYDYGETIAYTACTVGGQSQDENKLESTYGLGRVPFDLANPTQFSSGLDFRYSNPRVAQVFKFPTAAKRRFRLEITGGANPYFMINFATVRNHQLMNAGIGGFTAYQFLVDKNRRQVGDALKTWVPDAAFIILGGNDDWREPQRLVSRAVKDLSLDEVKQLHSMELAEIIPQPDGKFTAVRKFGLIDQITPTSLRSKQLVGAQVPAGSYLRIGNYYGDNESTAVRRVKTFDSQAGLVTWLEPLDPEKIVGIDKFDDLKGAEFTARTLADYKKNISGMIGRLRKANPNMKIVLLNTYTPNYFQREVWGYAEALTDVAAQYPGIIQADASPAVYAWLPTQFEGTKWHADLRSTGAASYDLPWKKHWQGFQVWVNGKNVYGKDCRVESGLFYSPELLKNGKWKVGRTGVTTRIPLKLVFTRNVPPAGTPIKVLLANDTWSNDYTHPSPAGCKIVGNVAFQALNQVMGIR